MAKKDTCTILDEIEFPFDPVRWGKRKLKIKLKSIRELGRVRQGMARLGKTGRGLLERFED